jgi:hypothetical protein
MSYSINPRNSSRRAKRQGITIDELLIIEKEQQEKINNG